MVQVKEKINNSIKKYDITQDKWEEVNINTSLIEEDINVHLLHLGVIRQLANARAGTASTLTRAEVRGGGRKPWRQKGTGRARAGSIRSPLWRGGGIIFGPKPRDYSIHLPKKMRQQALKSAITSRLEDSIIVDGLDSLNSIKTKDFVKILEKLEMLNKKLLIVIDKEKDYTNLYASTNNLKYVKIVYADNVGVYDLLKAENIIYTYKALDTIERRVLV